MTLMFSMSGEIFSVYICLEISISKLAKSWKNELSHKKSWLLMQGIWVTSIIKLMIENGTLTLAMSNFKNILLI